MNIKIFVTYKENYERIENNIIFPIQTGRKISDEIFEGMIGDDTGDNISNENDKYSELSAQYWIWKNYDKIGNPDYIGHMQYRRHFIFNENAKFSIETPKSQLNGFSVKFIEKLEENYINNIGLDENTIKNTCIDTDIIVVKKSNMNALNCKNAKEDFLNNVPGARETDYNNLIHILLEKHPEYKAIVRQFEDEPYRHFYHMFIMKKDIFFEYNNFIFPILKEIDTKIDYSCRGTRGKRVLGYLGEMLFCMFIFKKANEKYKIKEYYSTVILKNTKRKDSICKNFKLEKNFENCIYYDISNTSFNKAIESIHSLDSFFSEKQKYDLIIFHENLDYINFYKLTTLNLKNFQPILIDKKNIKSKIEPVWNKTTLTQLLYFLKDYIIAIHISPRIIFRKPTDFYKYTKNPITAGIYPPIAHILNKNKNIRALFENIIELDDIYKFYTTDIVIFNIKEINFDTIQEKINKNFLLNKSSELFNYLFKDLIRNFPDGYIFEDSETEERKYFNTEEFLKAKTDANCIYSDRVSTTRNKKQNYFYEKESQYNLKLNYILDHMLLFKCIKLKYKIKKAFSFGEKHERYKRKYKNVKQLINDAKQLKKQFLNFNY